MERLDADQAGLAKVLLVIVLAWALTAVLMLTRTLVAAQEIDQRVAFITTQVHPIAEDLDLIRLAADTDDIARGIHREVEPLDEQLGTVVDLSHGIDDTAGSILDTAGTIERRAGSIRDTAGSILTTARGINDTAGAINDTVAGIDGRFGDVLSTVERIACGTGLPVSPPAPEELAEQMRVCGDDGIPGINRREKVLLVLFDRIGEDLGNVLHQVGREHGTLLDATLHGHANSIDCRLPGGSHCQGPLP
jgi:hypothetical protein